MLLLKSPENSRGRTGVPFQLGRHSRDTGKRWCGVTQGGVRRDSETRKNEQRLNRVRHIFPAGGRRQIARWRLPCDVDMYFCFILFCTF